MKRSPSHAVVGMLFVLVCVGIGFTLFIASRKAPVTGPTPTPPKEAVAPISVQPSDNAPSTNAVPTPQTETNLVADEQAGSSDTMARLSLKEDMEYPIAKRLLIDQGYVPASGFEDPCPSIGEEECKPYPEIEECSGSGQGYCISIFRKDEKTVELTTYGPGGPVASADFR